MIYKTGQQLQATIPVVNNGALVATNVEVTVVLPTGVAYDSDIPTQGTYDSMSGVWGVGELTSGQSESMVLTVLITDICESPYEVTWTVSADQTDPSAANNAGVASFSEMSCCEFIPCLSETGSFDNTGTHLAADNVQDALTELALDTFYKNNGVLDEARTVNMGGFDLTFNNGGAVTVPELTIAGLSTGTADSLLIENTGVVEKRAVTDLTFTESQITDLVHFTTADEINDLTASVTWANIPDANVPESAVTQHEAALTITSTQVSDWATAEKNLGDDDLTLTANRTVTMGGNDLTFSGGNVGIGTTSPQAKLHIKDDTVDAQVKQRFENDVQVWDVWGVHGGDGDSYDIQDVTNNTYPFKIRPGALSNSIVINSTGVGIGAANPSSKLHLNGGVGSLATGLTFGDGDSGMYEVTDDNFVWSLDSLDLQGNLNVQGTIDWDGDATTNGGRILGQPSDAPVYQGSSYYFDGVDDVVTVADDDNLTFGENVTFRVRYSAKEFSSLDYLFVKREEYRLYRTATGVVRVLFFDSSGISNYTYWLASGINEEEWVDLVFVYDEGVMSCYQNGVEMSLTRSDAGIGFSTFNNTPYSLEIGARLGANYFSGQISDVQIFNYALSQDRIEEMYRGASTPYEDKGASPTELVTNGTFDTDTDWTKGAGWTISGGELVGTSVASATSTWQDIGLEVGKRYGITYTITNYSEGGVQVLLGGSGSTTGTIRTANGTYYEELINTSTGLNSRFYLRSSGTTTLNVDNVSVTQIGEVLSLTESGISETEWLDQSGNSLDGIVSGATVVNYKGWHTDGTDLHTDGHLTIGEVDTGTSDSFLIETAGLVEKRDISEFLTKEKPVVYTGGTLTSADSGKVFVMQSGAASSLTFTLPATFTAGVEYTFIDNYTSGVNTMTVAVDSGDSIGDSTGSYTTSFVSAAGTRNALKIIAIDSSTWSVVSSDGTWTKS